MKEFRKRIAFVLACLALMVSAAAQTAPTSDVNKAQVTGTIRVVISDDFQNHRSSLECFIDTPDGRIIPYAGPCNESIAGATVGLIEGEHKLLGVRIEPAAVTGRKSLAVILATFTDDQSRLLPVSEAEFAIFGNYVDSLVNRFRRNSYGRLELTGQVFDWVTVPPAKDPNTGQPYTDCRRAFLAIDAARQAAGASGYDYYMVVFPKITFTCEFAGQASILGQNSAVYYNPLVPGISGTLALHELAHNFGLHHSSFLNATTPGGPITTSSCVDSDPAARVCEYGDMGDPMGRGVDHLHAYNKAKLGWIDETDVLTLNAGSNEQTVTLAAIEQRSGVRDLTIPLSDAGGYSYHIEYRCCDLRLRGIHIRLNRPNTRDATGQDISTSKSYLVPSGYGDRTDALQAALTESGQAFTDFVRGIRVSLLAREESSATVRVSLNVPVIGSVNYNGGKKIVVVGNRFGSSRPQVMINGVDRSEFILAFSEKKIKIKGSPAALGLHPGQNSLQVVTVGGTAESNTFTFTV